MKNNDLVPQNKSVLGQVISNSDKEVLDGIATAVSDLSATASQIASVTDNAVEKAAEIARLREQRKAFEAAAKMETARIERDYEENKMLIQATFAKQSRAMDISERVLDDSLEKGNDEMVLAALDAIAVVAKSSIADELAKNNASKKRTTIIANQIDDTEALPWSDF